MAYVIKAAHVTDLKAIREAHLDDMDSLVIIGGKNGAGKTGLLRVLAGAVGFPWPDDLLRDGQERGEAHVQLVDGKETYDVHVVVTPKGQPRVTVSRIIDGVALAIKQPRNWLKQRLSGKHFDVLAAIDEFETPAGERAVLERMRSAAGLDFSDLDGEVERLREERKLAKRDLAQAEAARDAIPAGKPPQPADVAALVTELRQEQQWRSDVRNLTARVADHRLLIERLERQLSETRASLESDSTLLEDAKVECGREPEVIQADIDAAESINARVRALAERARHDEAAERFAAAEQAADARLDEIGEKKRSLLATADFGVPGLTLSDDLETILYEGEPLRRLSDGNKIAVFAMLHAAQNPDIGVMFSTRASLLDDEHLAFCDEVAQQMGMQFILEVVGSREGAIVIEATDDGSVIKETTNV